MKTFAKKKRGFTLIEMTVVLFIISLLILIIIPNISKTRDKARGVHQNAMVSVVQSQVDSYLDNNQDKDKYSVSMNTLVSQGYLTQKQQNQANNENIKISDDNHAYIDNSSTSKKS